MNDRKVVRDSPRWLSDWPPVSFIVRCVVGGTLMGLALVFATTAMAADTHHIHITTSNATEAVKWYAKHLDCSAVEGQLNVAQCDGVQVLFVVQTTLGASQGTGIDHIGFSYADLGAKMAELEAIGVGGRGVRHAVVVGRHAFERRLRVVQQRRGRQVVALAVVFDERPRGMHVVKAAILDEAGDRLSPELIEGCKSAEALMSVNNVWYKFNDLVSDTEIKGQPAKPRMNAMVLHGGVGLVLFETFSLAASVVNACGTCVDAHTAQLRKNGVSVQNVVDVGRIASIMKAIADTLTFESQG